jgi:hypothetical protein
MIRAQRAGRKTMTRRVIRPQPSAGVHWGLAGWEDGHGRALHCPYGQGGDRLWVRETHISFEAGYVQYFADYDDHSQDKEYGVQWTPSIYMPREASRTLLEVTAIRAERVQEIPEDDAKAEGCESAFETDLATFLNRQTDFDAISTYRIGFKQLWDSLNADPREVRENGRVVSYVSYPWEDVHEEREHRGLPWQVIGNPWVWVVQFKALEERTE